jgi:hypothetical protein
VFWSESFGERVYETLDSYCSLLARGVGRVLVLLKKGGDVFFTFICGSSKSTKSRGRDVQVMYMALTHRCLTIIRHITTT